MSNTTTLNDQLTGSIALAHERRLRNVCPNDVSADLWRAIDWALSELRRLRHEDEPAWERGQRALAAAQNAASECDEVAATAIHDLCMVAGEWFKELERRANYTAEDAAADRS